MFFNTASMYRKYSSKSTAGLEQEIAFYCLITILIIAALIIEYLSIYELVVELYFPQKMSMV